MDRRTIKLLGALTASVVIVVVAALLVRGGASAPGSQGSAAPSLAERRAAGGGDGWMSSLGVRIASHDPARPATDEDSVATVVTGTGRSREPMPPQVSPMPDAAAIAAGEAYAAAMPAVKRQVQAAIDGQKSAIRDACWTGEVPASASFPVEVSFDAEGQLLALSIGDNREARGIGPCVREQPLQLDIDAPGLPITVQATIDLP